MNPLSILSCVGMSTILLSHLPILAMILFALQGSTIFTAFFCALSTYISFYPVILCLPLGVILSRARVAPRLFLKSYDQKGLPNPVYPTVKLSGLVVLFLCCLLFTSYHYLSSWDFLSSCYGFVLLVPDLQPNIGLFWYDCSKWWF